MVSTTKLKAANFDGAVNLEAPSSLFTFIRLLVFSPQVWGPQSRLNVYTRLHHLECIHGSSVDFCVETLVGRVCKKLSLPRT